jgi:hypothetical protein
MRKHTPCKYTLNLFETCLSPDIHIYALIDPRDGAVRYIGQTKTPKRRLSGHMGQIHDSYKYRWIRRLKALGLRPVMEILEIATEANWSDRERYWISHYRSIGAKLTNVTSGGEGCFGRPLPLEQLARFHAHLCSERTDAWKRNISRSLIGNRPNATTLRKLQDSHSTVEWLLISPEGEQVRTRNLRKFCDDNGLNHSVLYSVSRGLYWHWKRWICYRLADDGNPIIPECRRRQPIIWKLTSPDGEEFTTKSLAAFCKCRGFQPVFLQRVGRGMAEHYKGWKCVRIQGLQ